MLLYLLFHLALLLCRLVAWVLHERPGMRLTIRAVDRRILGADSRPTRSLIGRWGVSLRRCIVLPFLELGASLI